MRPLTDVVHVQAPQTKAYGVNLTYYVAGRNVALRAEIKSAVKTSVADYVAWQRAALGRDVNPSELIRRVMAAGALRVEVTSPVHAVLTPSQVAVPSGDPVIAFGGFENG